MQLLLRAIHIPTMSTKIQQKSRPIIVTSALGPLLRERAVSQKQIAKMTGLQEPVLSRLKRRGIVRRIDCAVAVRICEVLSMLPRKKDRKHVRIGLDALFPMKLRS